ncbi:MULTISPECIES: amidase [unclassified Beijerinckia]|uniref:amidase n=1 Tax=unclassified Beijerinckia TaxID=2638183 RepID=UPI00089886BA|nr:MULTISPECIES: amidase [unclassified Beijerinckia]MDH7797141.1 Asp-tRNA(Asn)/Glu-tRNA(Gln) amidotransferase A subunit family amidase [Beijerinckia sp. GAS462]SEC73852.1 Asp-tRNAAsn/Glu-tRNAGln amidotransferase A subunit [Beijerinckia sp. 28-YEA-48]
MTDLFQLSAVEAAQKIRAGKLSAYALTRACLDRIEALENAIGAWVHLDAERALAQAHDADRQQAAGAVSGPLHGVPVGIKDVIDTADQPTQFGSPIFAGRQPENDATCVAALRGAGAIILGKTVTTELASLTPAGTRNPLDRTRTPGGSSSGSAAAVACGMVPLALGTQTAGSVIRPASFCGLFGFKPTPGFISRSGVLLQSHTLDTIGVFARSLPDVALIADCLGAQDRSDEISYPRALSRLLAFLTEAPAESGQFAFWRTPAWGHTEARTREAFDELVRELGTACQTIEMPKDCDHLIAYQHTIQSAENAAWYGSILDHHAEQLSPAMRTRLEAGHQVTARAYIEAETARDVLYAAMAPILHRYDAIICPAAPGPAPLGLQATGNPIFNALWTYLGVPAVTLPLLEVDGLPVGVQLIGPRRGEARLLRAARTLMERLNAEI